MTIMFEKLKSKIEMKYSGRKALPPHYYATHSDLSNPKLRSAKPGEFVSKLGYYKSGKILSVRYYES
jgi:hypothetical protein